MAHLLSLDAVCWLLLPIDCFELAAQEASPERRAGLLRFVVVGGGPTGVELMAEIRDLVEHVLFVRSAEVNPAEVDLVLVQSAPQLLPGWHATVVQRAHEKLTSLDIRVLTGRRVQSVADFGVTPRRKTDPHHPDHRLVRGREAGGTARRGGPPSISQIFASRQDLQAASGDTHVTMRAAGET